MTWLSTMQGLHGTRTNDLRGPTEDHKNAGQWLWQELQE